MVKLTNYNSRLSQGINPKYIVSILTVKVPKTKAREEGYYSYITLNKGGYIAVEESVDEIIELINKNK